MKVPIPFLEHIAYQMRTSIVKMTTQAGSGHLTSALSAADIVATLFFDVMRYDPDNYENPNNDRFILSKGHAAPVLYAIWKELGKLTSDDVLAYRHFNSPLEGHPTLRFKYAEAATGSLGTGLSIGVGEALCAKMDNRDYRTYVLLGDSEMSEGAIWEAIQIAAFYQLTNIVGIVDCNRLGQSTPTMEALEGDAPERFAMMVRGFGWQPYIVDGHDIAALVATFKKAHAASQPIMIIAVTKKGYGVDLVEDKEGFHGQALKTEDSQKALDQLKRRFSAAASYKGERYLPEKPKAASVQSSDFAQLSLPKPTYKKGDELPTRKAYGQALVVLGGISDAVISLDAEVKNSTYAELFEAKYPNRFIQCFIAEQNMISMGVGFDRRGKLPFISTFGCFLTRAHDQIRMAAIGTAALRLSGSHAGVSIGQDGPSQMALEDIAMMRSIPDSIVLYPCDAVSTYALVNQMARYDDGISYVRTTRMATPIIYDNDESFAVGGCKVIRSSDRDHLCIVGAGITVHEALKAYDQLKKDGILVAVIDLYCIKPLDTKTVLSVANAAKKRIITVEDHYPQGGIGEAVAAALCNDDITVRRLTVHQLPRSGKPEELLAFMEIDAAAIIKNVRQLLA
jgi:transketolase